MGAPSLGVPKKIPPTAYPPVIRNILTMEKGPCKPNILMMTLTTAMFNSQRLLAITIALKYQHLM